jgi:bifunctional DNA-binding transcriptional regulator/antitoxin component of YhaV-PrlF toxin-antitoxin module
MEHDPSTPAVVTVRQDGTIELPAQAVQRMGYQPGDRVSVRVSDAALSRRLMELGVTESEVDAIAERQLEPRENVARFLAAEGALRSKSSFRRRVTIWRQ